MEVITMTFYVVYVAGEYQMECYKRFRNEQEAIECAQRLAKREKGTICVYKETCEKIFTTD